MDIGHSRQTHATPVERVLGALSEVSDRRDLEERRAQVQKIESSVFPVATEAQCAPEAPSGPSGNGGGETILVVEDDPGLRQIMQEELQQTGYLVVSASSGEEAIELCRGRRGAIDLLLTDVIMPGMSGLDLARRLDAACPTLRTLYMSGYTADFFARKNLHLSQDDLLTKPFTHAALHSRIRALLDRAPGI
jgi:CheY-like chemotaxis protein